PKRGFRFAADVREIRTRGQNKSAENYLTFASEAESGAVIKSLAVLPFKMLGEEEKSNEYLGLGMAHDTIIKLNSLRPLVALPTRAVFKYAGRKNDPLALGRKLGVDAVLEGTIQRAGECIRVT